MYLFLLVTLKLFYGNPVYRHLFRSLSTSLWCSYTLAYKLKCSSNVWNFQSVWRTPMFLRNIQPVNHFLWRVRNALPAPLWRTCSVRRTITKRIVTFFKRVSSVNEMSDANLATMKRPLSVFVALFKRSRNVFSLYPRNWGLWSKLPFKTNLQYRKTVY